VHLRSVFLALGLTAALSGCAGWQRIEIGDIAAGLPARQQVQVWSSGTSRAYHNVQIRGDSLIGVPFQLPLSCDSCRVAIPLASVDSLRQGNQETTGIVVVGIVALAVGFLIWAASQIPYT